MKKRTLISLFGGCLLALSTQAVLADDIPTGAPMLSILKSLQAKGYSNINKIKFENGEYGAQVINSQGKVEKLQINAKTGEILNAPKPEPHITALEAVKRVDAAGYQNIYELAVDAHGYVVKALDKSGKNVDLSVDSATGKVTDKQSAVTKK